MQSQGDDGAECQSWSNRAIKKGHIRGIRFNTLEQLCLALRCQPGDLLEVMSEEDARKEFGLDWSAED
ncbi:helix-turn-helix domain-containing protein [Collinsella aerofaciens]